jgi:hypothetical protein
VSDITLPEGLEVVGEEDASVAVVSAPRAAIEEVAATEEAATTAEPEVIRAKKPDEEGSEK